MLWFGCNMLIHPPPPQNLINWMIGLSGSPILTGAGNNIESWPRWKKQINMQGSLGDLDLGFLSLLPVHQEVKFPPSYVPMVIFSLSSAPKGASWPQAENNWFLTWHCSLRYFVNSHESSLTRDLQWWQHHVTETTQLCLHINFRWNLSFSLKPDVSGEIVPSLGACGPFLAHEISSTTILGLLWQL